MNLLIIEDERLLGMELLRRFERTGASACWVQTLTDARKKIFEQNLEPDVILSDMNLPDGNALDLLRQYRAAGKTGEWVFLSAFGRPPDVKIALELGVVDFLAKPVDVDRLDIAIATAARGGRAQRQIRHAAALSSQRFGLGSFLGHSEKARFVRDRLEKLASIPFSNLMISGETGTGKGLAARIVHYNGARSERPLVEANCAAIPSDLFESELFGHEAGSFSGAKNRHRGLFEQADGGTLFLDEIGEMPLLLQTKLLKAIEDGGFRRIGGETQIKVDVQIIGASNRDLRAEVAANRFREDLFHRLAVFDIELPALRNRIDDLRDLVPVFLTEFNRRSGKMVRDLAPDLWESLFAHSWPGNVRELRNVIERGVLMADALLVSHDDTGLKVCGDHQADSAAARVAIHDSLIIPLDGSVSIDALERQYIIAVLKKCGGNVVASARELGTTREKLRYRLAKHGIDLLDVKEK